MKYTFTNYIDIATSPESAQIIQVACGGMHAYRRVKHLYPVYKYFKLGRISLKLVPASTLPVDPLGLSYDVDDPQTVDPRDQLNPGLVRITNGEQIFTDLSSLTETQADGVYRATMLDRRWSKFMLQSGFRRTATPRFWGVGTATQTVFPGAVTNMPVANVYSPDVVELSNQVRHRVQGTYRDSSSLFPSTIDYMDAFAGSSQRGLFTTGQRVRMGWLPTDSITQILYQDGATEAKVDNVPQIMPIPEIDVITIFLPKAYKTSYFYRLFVTESIIFGGLKNVGVSASLSDAAMDDEYNPIDVMLANESNPKARRPWLPLMTETPSGWNAGDGD